MILLKNQIQALNSFWFFPAALTASVVFFFLDPRLLSLLLLLALGIRIIATGQPAVIVVSFVCGISLLVICGLLRYNEQRPQPPQAVTINGQLMVMPDEIVVSGDQLQMDGCVQIGTFQQQTRAFYTLTSAAEQRWWQQQTQPLMLAFSGRFVQPKGRTNKNGFDYAFFLRQKGIQQILQMESVKISGTRPKSLLTGLRSLRKKAILHTEQFFDSRTAMYMNVLLWGAKTEEFASMEPTLSALGILHLFSLSGMHVGFFSSLLRYVALRGFRVTVERVYWVQLFFSFLYSGITGFSVSVVRALLQKNIADTSRHFCWHFSALDCWSLTLLIHLCLQPWLLFTVGGKYSYFISFVLLFTGDLTKRIRNRPLKSFCFSVILSLASLPLATQTFYEWQPLSSLITFLLLPVFQTVLLPLLTFGFLSSLIFSVSIIKWGLAVFFQGLEWLLLLMEKQLHFSVVMGRFNEWLQLVCYLCLLLIFLYGKNNPKKIFYPVLGLCFLLNSKYFTPFGTMAMIDVGQGDSLFIQLPFHQSNILIDTGGASSFAKETWRLRKYKKAGALYSVIPYLKSQGVTKLDAVIITHSHDDHFGDLQTVSDQMKIKRLYFPKGAETNAAFALILKELQSRGTTCIPLLAPKLIKEAMAIQLLSPMKSGTGGNDDSLVTRIQLGGKYFLFTGDLEAPGEQALLKHYPSLTADILKVGHHGSKTSSSATFIRQLAPHTALISCGLNNRFKHPHEETLSTLRKNQIKIYRTDQNGMIYFEWTPFTGLSPAKLVKKAD